MAAHIYSEFLRKVLHSTFFTALLVLVTVISPAASLTFNFTTFDQTASSKFRFGDGANYFNNASVENGTLILTKMTNWTAGQTMYTDSVHLWDAASGSLADFSTHFSFVIDSSGVVPYADGMAFFLAPVDFPVPEQYGGAFGIISGITGYNSTKNPFVAVEFDTYQNVQFADMAENHVGIDVSSLKSIAAAIWRSSVEDGKLCEAWIDYKAATHMLSVVFTGFNNNTTVLQSVNYTIDLRKILPEYVRVGFGAATGAYSELHSVKSWSFSSNLAVNNDTTGSNGSGSRVRARSRTGLVAGVIASAAVATVVALISLTWFLVRRRRRKDRVGGKMGMNEEFEKKTGPKKFEYKALARATRQFDSKNKLGEGGFGGVYKGLISGNEVAVKRVSQDSRQGVKEYASEVLVISQLRHRNLVELIGWCHEGKELLLVYDFLPNGSLDSHLYKSEIPLTWALRYQIVQGLASALLYLHDGCKQYIVHRDIKSSNVMIDSSFHAKLGDFGLARLVDHGKGSATTMLAGTKGYIDPESFISGKTTKQSDVYSFGIVALEVACGRKPVDHQAPENEIVLVDWVYELNQCGKLLDAADPKLCKDYNAKELECMLMVGLWCAQPNQNSRPSMRQASLVLNFEAPLPNLPSLIPKAFSSYSDGFNEDGSTQCSNWTCPKNSMAINRLPIGSSL